MQRSMKVESSSTDHVAMIVSYILQPAEKINMHVSLNIQYVHHCCNTQNISMEKAFYTSLEKYIFLLKIINYLSSNPANII